MKKVIQLFGHHPSAYYQFRNTGSLWEDIDVLYRGKPGRKEYYHSLTLMGYKFINTKIEFSGLMMNDNLLRLKVKDDPGLWEHLDHLREKIAELEDIKVKLANSTDGIWIKPMNHGLHSIYTVDPLITRAVAEEVISKFLKGRGLNPYNLKFKWRPSELMTLPV